MAQLGFNSRLLLGRSQPRWPAAFTAARTSQGQLFSRSIRSRVLALDVEEPIVEDDYAIVTVHLQMVAPDSITLGDELRVVGSCGALGRWQPDAAPRMQRAVGGGAFYVDVNLPPGEHQFKVITFNKKTMMTAAEEEATRVLQVRADGVTRSIQVPETPGWLRVNFTWGDDATITSFLPETKEEIALEALEAKLTAAALEAAFNGEDVKRNGMRPTSSANGNGTRSRSKTPTAYNIFIGEVIKKLKEEEPALSNKERMQRALAMWREKKAAGEVGGRSPSPLRRTPPSVMPSSPARTPSPRTPKAARPAAVSAPAAPTTAETEVPDLPPAARAALEAAKAAESRPKAKPSPKPTPSNASLNGTGNRTSPAAIASNGVGSAAAALNGVAAGVTNAFSRARLKSLTKGLGSAPPVRGGSPPKAVTTPPALGPATAPGTEGAWKAWVGGVAVTGITAAALVLQATTNPSNTANIKKLAATGTAAPTPKPAVVVQQDEEEEEVVVAEEQRPAPLAPRNSAIPQPKQQEQQQQQQQPLSAFEREREREPEPEPEFQEPGPLRLPMFEIPEEDEDVEDQGPTSLFEQLREGTEEEEEAPAQVPDEEEDPMAVLRQDPDLPRSLEDIADDAEPGSLYEAFFGTGGAEEEEEAGSSMTLGIPQPSQGFFDQGVDEEEQAAEPSSMFERFFGGNTQPEQQAQEQEEEAAAEDSSTTTAFQQQQQQQQEEADVEESEPQSLFQRLFGASSQEEEDEQQPAAVTEEEYEYEPPAAQLFAPAQQQEEEEQFTAPGAVEEEEEQETLPVYAAEEEQDATPSFFDRLFGASEQEEEEEAGMSEEPPAGQGVNAAAVEAEEDEGPQGLQQLLSQQEEEEPVPAVEEEEEEAPAWSPVLNESIRQQQQQQQQDTAPRSFFERMFSEPEAEPEPEVFTPAPTPARAEAKPAAAPTSSAPKSFFEQMFGNDEEEAAPAVAAPAPSKPAPAPAPAAAQGGGDDESLSYFERLFRTEEAQRGSNPIIRELANASLFDELAGSNLPEEVAAPRGTKTITLDQLTNELGGSDLLREFSSGQEEVAPAGADLKALVEEQRAAAQLLQDFSSTSGVPAEDDGSDDSLLFAPKPSTMEVWDDCMVNSC